MLEYIDMLPTASRFYEAIMNDPDMAEQLARMPKPKDPWSPKISEWDLHAMQFAQMLNALDGVRQAVIATAGGGKPKPAKPFPQPITAVDRARQRLDQEFATDIVGMFGFSEEDLLG